MKRAWSSPEVLSALARIDPGVDPMSAQRALRKSLPPELARAAAELRELRRRAAGRFGRSDAMFFTSRGLEQATRESLAKRRAAVVSGLAPGAWVLDATAGIGSDALALSEAGLRVAAADRDPEVLACAAANLEAFGQPVRALVAEAERPAVRADLLVVDPDRRVSGRSLDPGSWSPSGPAALDLAGRFAGACLKLAPALDPRELPSEGLWEWVGQGSELLEVCLWTGELAPAPGRAAVLVAADGSEIARFSAEPREVEPLEPDQAHDVGWIGDPHPALVRSGLLGALAAELGARPVGPRIGYLGAEQPFGSPWLSVFRVLGTSSADPKRVRALLGEHDVGPVEVRRRGHPDSPEVLARRFRGPGRRRGTVLVARLARGHAAWLVEPASR